MGILVILGSGTEDWLRYRWAPAEGISMLLSLAAVIHAIVSETAAISPGRRFLLRSGAACTSLAIVGLIWFGIHYHDPYWIFVVARSRAWQWSTFCLAFVAVGMPGWPKAATFYLLMVAATHSAIGPMVHWSGPAEQTISRLILIGASVCWVAASGAWRRSAGGRT
jgi:hypothetical protein